MGSANIVEYTVVFKDRYHSVCFVEHLSFCLIPEHVFQKYLPPDGSMAREILVSKCYPEELLSIPCHNIAVYWPLTVQQRVSVLSLIRSYSSIDGIVESSCVFLNTFNTLLSCTLHLDGSFCLSAVSKKSTRTKYIWISKIHFCTYHLTTEQLIGDTFAQWIYKCIFCMMLREYVKRIVFNAKSILITF